ncbi:MAG: hypothetical protein HC825_01790 [Oscillatoriales cyanobacterium RM1_1_9]|nr:hypothetical protein [Oscillatoriales cyanobacterium RM1_1_9]
MGIATQVKNTATVDFNNLSGSSTGFENEFASYSFKKNSIRVDQWAPENIDRTVSGGFEGTQNGNTSIDVDNPYLTIFGGNSVTINLEGTANYFGLNWGSVSANNRIEFWNGDTLVNAFQSAGNDLNKPVEGQAELNAAWQGAKGTHTAKNFWNEADAYLEFWADGSDSLFNKIVLTQVNGNWWWI